MKDKFNLFKIFTPKSITKDNEFNEVPTNFKGFFVMLGRKFWNISNLSLLYSFVNLPFIFLFLAFSFTKQQVVVSSPMTASLYGIAQVSESVSHKILFPVVSAFKTTSYFSTASYICLAISILFVLTFGISNIGSAYVIRGYNRGDPVFLVSDFFGCIKRNWKQGLIIGIVDILFTLVLVFDFLFWNGQSGFMNGVFMYFSLFLCVLYFIMRFYIYTIAVTFDLTVYKIFKDAFLLAFLGLKRNFLALFGLLIVIVLSFNLCTLYLPLGVMMPIVLTFGLCMFISGYASYPVIKKYMIDPFYDEESGAKDTSDDDAVFEDRG